MLEAMRCFLAWVVAASTVACGDPCEDLREVCNSCPDTTEGQQAKRSCLGAADSGDELGCEDRLDTEIYASYGCSYD
jgi:hypothetical protein